MTTKNRIAQLEKNAPKNAPKVVNPLSLMSDAELLQKIKSTLEDGCLSTGDAIPENSKKMLENILTNHGIAWTVKL